MLMDASETGTAAKTDKIVLFLPPTIELFSRRLSGRADATLAEDVTQEVLRLQ